MKFRLATWNINSIRRRVDLLGDFVRQYSPDVICLQEIKCMEEQFPFSAVRELGYEYIEINGQKAYHGVAIISRMPVARHGADDFNNTGEARHICVKLANTGLRSDTLIHNFYVPAGGDIPDVEQNPKYAQKLEYLRGMKTYFDDHSNKDENRMILVGDLNVAPLEHDVWSHKQLMNVVSHTPLEIEHLEHVYRSHSWVDIMRQHVPDDQKLYTWWSYRARDWKASNRGRRLDHVWVTPTLSETAKSMIVGEEARGWDSASDHAPVIVDFDLK